MIPPIRIGKKLVGAGQPVFIVAEISANHHQDYDEAVRLFRAAKEAGADAVKIQTYTADTITLACANEYFRIQHGTPWDGATLHELYAKAFTPWEWQPDLKKVAEELDLEFFSAAFDPSAVDFLENLQVPVHKVASFELVDIPLIEKMARTGKPLILSTGLASVAEIQEAVQAARAAGAKDILILKCTSAYPAPPESMNLRAIPELGRLLNVHVGLSDHTLGTTIPVAAAALGACLIEKHFTGSRKTQGPDSAFSLEPQEFKQMVDAVRICEKSLGSEKWEQNAEEKKNLIFRRSLFVVRDVRKGETLTEEHVRSIRPGYGLAPKHIKEILGRTASRDIERGTPLSWDCVV